MLKTYFDRLISGALARNSSLKAVMTILMALFSQGNFISYNVCEHLFDNLLNSLIGERICFHIRLL